MYEKICKLHWKTVFFSCFHTYLGRNNIKISKLSMLSLLKFPLCGLPHMYQQNMQITLKNLCFSVVFPSTLARNNIKISKLSMLNHIVKVGILLSWVELSIVHWWTLGKLETSLKCFPKDAFWHKSVSLGPGRHPINTAKQSSSAVLPKAWQWLSMSMSMWQCEIIYIT